MFTVKDQIIYQDGEIKTPTEIADLLNIYEQIIVEQTEDMQTLYDEVIIT